MISMRLKHLSLPFFGFLQATGLFVYVLLIALLMSNINKIFVPNTLNTGILEPIAVLMLFIISATITGSLVLARAGFLFWEKRYKEAIFLTLWTLGWAIFYLISIFLILLYSK